MWMAFEVILLHRMSWKGYDSLFFAFLKRCELFSVPVFVIIAFYFCARTLEEGNKEKIRQRFIRLIIPQVGWAIICWVVYVLTDIIFAHQLNHNLMDLIIAIISGCRQDTNPSTWFQAVLIILTLIYCLIFRFCGNKKWYVVYSTFMLALFIQWNGAYYDFFQQTPYEVANTIGRIFELMPFACVGILLSHYKIYTTLINKRIWILATSLLLFSLGFVISFPSFKGFFEGFFPLYMAICLFIFFLFLPTENIEGKSRNLIIQITRYTLGIYCAHRLVYGILDIVYELLGIDPGSFMKCIIVYLACYVMSYIMSIIPIRYLKEMVD